MLESSNDASWSGRIQIYQILTYDLWWFNIVDIGHNPVTYPKPKEPTSHHCLNHTQSTNSYGVKLTFSSLILILETIVGWSCARKQLPNSFPAQKKPSNNNPFVSSSSWSSDANVNHIISNLILSSPCQLDNQQLYNYIYNQINIYIYKYIIHQVERVEVVCRRWVAKRSPFAPPPRTKGILTWERLKWKSPTTLQHVACCTRQAIFIGSCWIWMI